MQKDKNTIYLTEFSMYLKQRKLSPVTLRGYIFDCSQFLEWLCSQRMEARLVGDREAQAYVKYLQSKKYLPATILKKVCSLRAFYKFLENFND